MLTAGKFKVPVGLERLQSATDIRFIERAFPTSLVPNRDLGLSFGGDAAGGVVNYSFGYFNGVSDALEGNVAYNLWPVDFFSVVNGGFFDELSAGAIVSARGNTLVNNYPFPVEPIKGGTPFQFWTDYYAKALEDSTAGTVPVLAAATSRDTASFAP